MTPLSLTGGESPLSGVLIDWVSTTFPRSAIPDQGEFLKRVRRLFDGTVTEFRQRQTGLHCYQYSAKSDIGGVIIAWGGNNDTVLLQIPGDACARVTDWPMLRDFIAAHAGHLTRLDIAFDDFEGKQTVDLAVELYRSGAFTGNGRPPSCSQAGNWLAPDGSGRTLYIGKSKNGKLLRVYEKGKEQGDCTSPWVRWEVQLTDRDRTIPLDALCDPAPFFRGAYPALEFINGESCRIATRRAQERISVEKLSRHARDSYGGLVDFLARSGSTSDELLELLRRDALPRRLSAPTDAELCDRANFLASVASREERETRVYH